MAALVFTEHLRRAGLDGQVDVTSAGIGSWHAGENIDARAARTLAERGYHSDNVANVVGQWHLSADLLLAMDAGHERALRQLVDDPARVRMFRSFDPDATGDLDVPDPYYGDTSGFLVVLDMIEAGTEGLLGWVRARLAR